MQDSAKRFYQVFFLNMTSISKCPQFQYKLIFAYRYFYLQKAEERSEIIFFLSCNSITWTNLLTIIILLHYVCHFSWYWCVIFESLRNTLMLLYMYPKNFVKVFILKVYFLLQTLNFFYVNTQQHDCLPYSLKNSKL